MREQQAAQFQANAAGQRQDLPADAGASHQASHPAGKVQERKGTEIPDVVLIGNGLSDQSAH